MFLNVHISGTRCFKNHQNSTRGPPRERRNNENCGGRGTKKREILCSPPFGAPPCMNCVCPPRKTVGWGEDFGPSRTNLFEFFFCFAKVELAKVKLVRVKLAKVDDIKMAKVELAKVECSLQTPLKLPKRERERTKMGGRGKKEGNFGLSSGEGVQRRRSSGGAQKGRRGTTHNTTPTPHTRLDWQKIGLDQIGQTLTQRLILEHDRLRPISTSANF